MKLRYTILYVQNVEETLEFYKRAFNQKLSMLHESGDYGELSTGSTTLSFSSLELMAKLGKKPSTAKVNAPTFEIAFETDDVSLALKQAISAGAKLIQDVEHMPWGQTTAYVSDINGFLVEICTPIQT